MNKLGVMLLSTLPLLCGFNFVAHSDAALADEASITIRSESLVGLKLSVNGKSILLTQDHLMVGTSSLDAAVIGLPSGDATIMMFDADNKPLVRVRFSLEAGDKKYLRLRR
tara:strand:- start:312 stop:644 length:333 start_codon:yes stop_codon:yes gene_type:complete